ncbi:MAG TPA: hypothetical protein VMQ86_25540 [Bryobacteraceae bacterium]|jgi:hypothetical protein|nr:hypothetical protein [Bryobacteraceae bacterium]
MITPMPFTLPVTAPGPGQSINGAALIRPITLSVLVQSLTGSQPSPQPAARIAFEDSTNGTSWTCAALIEVTGPIGKATAFSLTDDQLSSLQIGSTGCQLRPNVYFLQGTVPQLQLICLVQDGTPDPAE